MIMTARLAPLLVTLSALACKADTTTGCAGCELRTAPPEPIFSAKIRAVPVAGGRPNLQAFASLVGNSTTFIVQQCQLPIALSPYPPGSYGAGAACSGMTYQLNPGDTLVMTRVLTPVDLASYAPGQWRVAVSVTYQAVGGVSSTAGLSAGIVQLPLDSSSQIIDSSSH